MNRSIIIPDLTWYSAKSKEEGGSPRCPFASEELCPRYYESRLLLGKVGVTTEVSPEDRARLNRKWKALNPTTAEQAASVSSRGDGLHCVSNFCPEVSYEIYGFFARYLGPYSDELDRDAVHEFLSKRRVRVSDPRWQWKSISPCHYTECREFSILGSPVARFHLEMEGGDGVPAAVEHSAKTTTRRVFLVHGHDDEARYSVARFLEQLDLKVVVLNEQTNASITVIEKLEKHADVGFAVVLLTPDDEGRKKGTKKLLGRARQNVILELGYFISKLGRERVCALQRGDLEVPSDVLGVLTHQIDPAGAWKTRLAKELQEASFDVDLNKM